MSVACLIWFLCLRFLYNISTDVDVVNVFFDQQIKSSIFKYCIDCHSTKHTWMFMYAYVHTFQNTPLYSYLHFWEIYYFDLVFFASGIRTSNISQVGKNSCPSLIFSSKAFSLSFSTLHSCAHNDYKQPAEKHTPVETPLVDRDCLNV